MDLDANGKTVAEPEAADVVRAIDERGDNRSWHIRLTRPDGFYLEVVPVEGGLCKLVNGNAQQKLRHVSEVAIEVDQAKEFMTDFLAGGTAWRALWSSRHAQVQPHRATDDSKTGMATYSGRQMAVIAVVIVVGGAVYQLGLASPATVLIFMFGGIFGLMIVFKSWQEIQVRRWPRAAGTITKCALQFRRQRFRQERTRLDNIPDVEYRFAIAGVGYVGTRVGLNTEYAGENVAEIVRRYPFGAAVQVAYNPIDPTDCLLEPDANSVFLRQLLLIVAIPAAALFAIIHGAPYIAPWVLERFPRANVLQATIAFALALYMIPMFVRSLVRGAPPPATMAETTGKVVVSEVEEIVDQNAGQTSGSMIREPFYQPTIEVAYAVGGFDYRQRMMVPDFSPVEQQPLGRSREGTQSAAHLQAEAALGAWPVGRAVTVSYATKNPGVARLGGAQPLPRASGWFGRTILPPIAIAGVIVWGLRALGIV